MEKQIHAIAGLPRSGSTLLANLLAQNPRFEATASNDVLNLIGKVIERWDQVFPGGVEEQRKRQVVRGMMQDFYSYSDRPVVFDKCRGWLEVIELFEGILQRKAKILVTVRDLREVLASFEKLWRTTSATTLTSHERGHPVDFQSLEGRCDIWLKQEEVIGREYDRIQTALKKGFRDRLHFVRFEELTSRPRETMQAIYKFLGEEWFEHDFENVKQVTWENDAVHGLKGLHDIRPKVAPVPAQHPRILGKLAEKYKGIYIWDQPQWK